MKIRLLLTMGLITLAHALTIICIVFAPKDYLSFCFIVIAIIIYASLNSILDRRYIFSRKFKTKAAVDFGVKDAYVLFVCIVFFLRLEIISLNYIFTSILYLASITTSFLVYLEYKNCRIDDNFKVKMQHVACSRLLCAYTLYAATIFLITITGKSWSILYIALPVCIIAVLFNIFGYKIIEFGQYGIKVRRIVLDILLIVCGMVLVFLFSDSTFFNPNINLTSASIPIIPLLIAALTYIPSAKTYQKIYHNRINSDEKEDKTDS